MSFSNSPQTIGRHQLLRPLGAGGMGTLYLATDPLLNRVVAIKVLRDEIDSPQLRERFKREAKSAGSLKHRNIVTILDVGEDGGKPFIVMEYIEGETLTAIIRRGDQLTLARKLQLMIELCEGMHCAHSAKPRIVHRDISPSNIMVDELGVLKILDFGVAKIGTSDLTVDTSVVGKLSYMPPEQLLNQPIDVRADMFSAGVVFYELLSYRRAFPGDNYSVIHNIIEGTPEPLEKIVPGLDPQLIAIVNRCLAKKPDGRYDDMERVRRELVAVRTRLTSADTGTGGRLRRPELEQVRQQEMQAELEAAYRALEAGDHARALQHSRKLLLYDETSEPAQEIEARALRSIQEALIQKWLADARLNLESGHLTAASLLVDQALSLSSSTPEALAIRQLVDDKRREIAEARERAERLDTLVAAAEQQLAGGELELALETITQAVGLDPTHRGAAAVKGRIVAAVEEEKRAKLDRAARAVVDEARRQFAAGQYVSAFQLLQRDTSRHPLVAATFEELRAEAAEIERRYEERKRREEEERKRREEEERKVRDEEERRRQIAERQRLELERAAKREAEREAERARAQQQREAEAEARRKESELRRRQPEPPPVDDDLTNVHPVMDETAAAQKFAAAAVTADKIPPRSGPSARTALQVGGVVLAAVLIFAISRYVRRSDIAQPPSSPPAEVPQPVTEPLPPPVPTPENTSPPPAAVPPPAPAPTTPASSGDSVTNSKPVAQPRPPTQGSVRPTTPGTVSTAPVGAAATPTGAPPEEPVDPNYRRAKDAFDAGRFAEAMPLLRALQTQRPNYRDTAQMLAETDRQQRAAGRQAMDQGARLEASGNLRGAVEQYDRAPQLDPSSKDVADAASRRVRSVMRTATAQAIKQGDLNYALDRVADAIRFYEQALNNMFNDDPARRTVESRLTELRARK